MLENCDSLNPIFHVKTKTFSYISGSIHIPKSSSQSHIARGNAGLCSQADLLQQSCKLPLGYITLGKFLAF